MKSAVFILALLAGLKLGHQEYLYRTATRDVIIAAYRAHAVQACQRDGRNKSLGLSPQAWSHSTAIQLAIGKSSLDVQFWQIQNDLWNVRYRNPFLVLSAGTSSQTAYCEYDIINAATSVHRM